MQKVNMMVTWVSIATEVMVMKGVSDVCQANQITWIWHPCSWCPSGRTWFSPLWAWGLERSWFQAAISSLFSLDGLEMTYHHSKWVLSELCFSCRLCHWGLGSCMSEPQSKISVTVPVNHVGGPILCLLGKNCTCSFTLSTHRSFALCALLNCSFCVFCTFNESLPESDVCWSSLEDPKRTATCAGHLWRISAGEGRSVKMGVSCSWSSALAWALGDPSVLL